MEKELNENKKPIDREALNCLPMRVKSPYICFVNDTKNCNTIQSKRFNIKSHKSSKKQWAERGKRLGEAWKSMSHSKRQVSSCLFYILTINKWYVIIRNMSKCRLKIP